ncbi:helix-turn-helix transcriptional regulator [Bacillus subtilis]|nr:helix-turn-helix transcriptional regulator [Bacillus subtilis]
MPSSSYDFPLLYWKNKLLFIRTLYVSGKELSCGEVGEKCNIVKTTASYHFKTLREAGLTATRKDSRTKYVSLREDTFQTYLPGFLETL